MVSQRSFDNQLRAQQKDLNKEKNPNFYYGRRGNRLIKVPIKMSEQQPSSKGESNQENQMS